MDNLLEAFARAADALVDFLERKRGLNRKRHQAHLAPAMAAVKGVIAGYFRRQGEALLVAIEPHIPTLHTSGDSTEGRMHGVLSDGSLWMMEASNGGKSLAASVLPDSLAPLRFAITAGESVAFQQALTTVIEGAAATLSQEMSLGTIAAPSVASDYLAVNSLSKLTGEIASATKDKLRAAIADAWDAGGSYTQIVDAIKSTVEEFSDVRAGMIAQNEVNDAYNAGRTATARAAGLSEKSWETESANPCPVCTGNEDDGWIGMDDSFSSGDDAPTAHVNCQCILNFRG